MSKHALWLSLALVGCGGGGNDYTVDDIESGAIAGQIGGASWEMVEALVRIDEFDDTALSIRVYAEDIDDCLSPIEPTAPFLLFNMPATTGEYPLSFSLTEGGQTVTMVEPPATNTIATEGIIDLVLDGDSVDLGLVAVADDANTVNGTLSTTLCGGE